MIAGAVIAALVTKFAALPALAGVPVYAALPVTDAADPDFVVIGHDGRVDSETELTVTYEWANLNCTSRYELGEIPCALVTQSGDDDMQARFDRFQILMQAMENALVTDMSTAGALSGLVMGVTITSGGPLPLQNEDGSGVIGPFVVSYRAQV
jgi:hypothetical protein